MKIKNEYKQVKRKAFYKLLDSFEEKDFYAVKNFAEYIKTKNGKKTLKDVLSNASVDSQPLSDDTLKSINESRTEIKNGKTHSLAQIKNELGF